jgi:hypothetical protein
MHRLTYYSALCCCHLIRARPVGSPSSRFWGLAAVVQSVNNSGQHHKAHGWQQFLQPLCSICPIAWPGKDGGGLTAAHVCRFGGFSSHKVSTGMH